MKESVSQSDFTAIVTEILQQRADVEDFSVQDKGVSIHAVSRLRREKVDVFLDFDDGGRITGRFAYAQSCAGTTLPENLGNAVAAQIKQFRTRP